MKRILSLILIISLFSVTLAFGAAPAVSIDKVFENTSLNQTVVVKGNISGGKTMVSLVAKNGTAIKILEQINTDNQGNYEFRIPFNTIGEYTGYVNSKSENVKYPISFEILSEPELDSLVAPFNATDATTSSVGAAVDTTGTKLGLDMKYYSEYKASVVSALYSEKGSFTIGNINSKFDKASLLGVFSGNAADDMKEAVNYYSTQLGLTATDNTNILYNSLVGITAVNTDSIIVTAFNNVASETHSDFASVKASLESNLLTESFKTLDFTLLDVFITQASEAFNFDGYSSLSVAKKQYVLNMLKTNTLLKTLTDYYNYYIEVYDDDITEGDTTVITPPPATPGTSGGGGGGGTTKYTPPEELEKDQEKTEEKPEAAIITFTDIASVPWAKEAIEKLANKKIVSGRADGIFCPDDNITRAEFVKLVVSLFGCHNPSLKSKFSDVSSNDWYDSYVASAVAKSIISGRENNTFGGNENIKREDMAVILYRAIISFNVMDEVTELTNNITDFDKISDYAKNSVLMLTNMKIISGKGNGIFDGGANATRAEACVMINNLLEGMK